MDSIQATNEILECIEELRGVKVLLKKLKAQEDNLKSIISNTIGDKKAIIDDEGEEIVTYKACKPFYQLSSVKAKAVLDEATYLECCEVVTRRNLVIK